MHRIFRIIAIILLLFNAISALFGGWSLMSDPSGETLDMPFVSWNIHLLMISWFPGSSCLSQMDYSAFFLLLWYCSNS